MRPTIGRQTPFARVREDGIGQVTSGFARVPVTRQLRPRCPRARENLHWQEEAEDLTLNDVARSSREPYSKNLLTLGWYAYEWPLSALHP